ncbi:MAG: (Fe-S)-binding protein [Acidimicrobiia bacterium]|nr:(Fe-S)-binding protein [Acidimicrobiia bacterium]
MTEPVQLFVTCLVNSLYPDVGKATVRLVEQAGFRAEFPLDQTCCGQPAYNGGFAKEAAAMARQTVDVLDETEGPIVVPSGSCAAMLTHHIPDLVKDDDSYVAAARRVANRTRELTQFLVEVGHKAAPVECDERVTYHASCHGLRWLQILEQPKSLLDEAGVTRVDLPGEDECCGFGGLFALKMPELSTAMMDTKIANIEASGADVVVGVDVSCLMHIGGGLRRRAGAIRTKHVAEVLAGESE